MKPISILIAAAAALLTIGTAASRGDTFSLTATADAFVAAAQPTNNYGGGGGLALAAAGLPRGEFQSVIRFDTAAARAQFDAIYGAGQWTISAVTLRLTATNPNNPIFNSQAPGLFRVHWMNNDAWIEGSGTPSSPATTGITFATLPTFISPGDTLLGTLAFGGGSSGAAVYPLSPEPGFAGDIAAGGLVSLRLEAADPTVAYVFNSRNFGTPDARPTLTITAVPEPQHPLLMMLGVLLSRRCVRCP